MNSSKRFFRSFVSTSPFVPFVLLSIGFLLSDLVGSSADPVHGTRARNSSVSLRSFVSDRRDEPNEWNGDEVDCDYCHPKECLKDDEKIAFCFVERDDENGYADDQICAIDGAETVRRRIVGERLQSAVTSACQISKRSPFVFVCWCKYTTKSRILSKYEQVQERNRQRVNSGRRGGLQIVSMLSVSRPAQVEPLLKPAPPANRPSAHFDFQTPSPASNASTDSTGIGWNGHIAHREANGPSSTSHVRPDRIRQTIPRRPSPARSFASMIRPSILLSTLLFCFVHFI